MPRKPTTAAEYLNSLPPATRSVVDRVRAVVVELVPEVDERLSYDILGFSVEGRRLVHVGGWAKHVSLYPVPLMVDAVAQEIAPYLSGRSTIKLPLDADVAERVTRLLLPAYLVAADRH